MATITKTTSGNYRVRIRKGGIYHSKTFTKKAHAQIWAKKMETEISEGSAGIVNHAGKALRFREVLARYIEDYPLTHDGKPMKIGNPKRVAEQLGRIKMSELEAEPLIAYRNRLVRQGLSASAVNKDLIMIGAAIKYARRCGLKIRHNPIEDVDKLKANDARSRRLSPAEEEELLSACDRCDDWELRAVIILAIETAMRAGELLSLHWEHVNAEKKTCFLPKTKNGAPRTVPLSRRAWETLSALGEARGREGRVFSRWSMTSSLDHAWRRLLKTTTLKDLRFHDLRHEATSRLFEKKLDPLRVSMITGHKSLNMLKRYTHLQTEDLVDFLWKNG